MYNSIYISFENSQPRSMPLEVATVAIGEGVCLMTENRLQGASG